MQSILPAAILRKSAHRRKLRIFPWNCVVVCAVTGPFSWLSLSLLLEELDAELVEEELDVFSVGGRDEE